MNKVKFPFACLFFMLPKFLFYVVAGWLSYVHGPADDVVFLSTYGGIYLFLFLILLIKKRNMLLRIAIFGVLLSYLPSVVQFVVVDYNGYENYWYEFICYFLNLLSISLLFTFSILLRDRGDLSNKFEQLKVWCRRCFFLPAFILFASEVLLYYVCFYMSGEYSHNDPFIEDMVLFVLYGEGYLIDVPILFFLALWLAYPFKKKGGNVKTGLQVCGNVVENIDNMN
ncbi:MAG: hypothetical protein J6V41_06600 [Kiritimatiellae bacterium]|nr:hypothetical protein [Kiritimatiellia bacterium]